jgi:RHS repeat-associated protein
VGTYTYYAVDNATGATSNTVTFTVYNVNPQVSVSPTSGPQGTTFSEPGTGFTPNGTATLYFSGPDGPSTYPNKTILANGTYQHSWTCNACPVGTYTYYAVDNATGATSNTVTFTVTQPLSTNLVPFHRGYSSSLQDHLYTTHKPEITDNPNYTYERVEGYVYTTAVSGTVPLYRYYNSSIQRHYYSTNSATPLGYVRETTPGYVFPVPTEGTVPLYHLELESVTNHFYTISEIERSNAIKKFGFRDWGISAYIPNNPRQAPLAGRPVAKSGNVDLYSGNFQPFYNHVDLSNPPGKGIPFVFARTYNAFNPEIGPLGIGWTHNYQITITEDSDPAKRGALVKWGDGRTEFYTTSDGSTFSPPVGVYDTLVKDGNSFILTTKDETRYIFDVVNEDVPENPAYPNVVNVKTIEDRFSNQLSIKYSNAGLISEIKDGSNRSYIFGYKNLVSNNQHCESDTFTDASKCRLVQIIDIQGELSRILNFGYYSDGNLAYSNDLEQKQTRYEYGTNPAFSNYNLLTKIILPKGNEWEATYDEQRRLQQQKIGIQAVRYDYNDTTKVTYVTPGFMSGSTFTPQGNTATCTHATGSKLDTCTDQAGNKSDIPDYLDTVQPRLVIDGERYTWAYEYEPLKGNIKKVTNPITNEFTQYFYDNDPVAGANPGLYVTKIIDPQGWVTRYEYDISPGPLATWNVVRVIEEDATQPSHPTTNISRYSMSDHPEWNGLVKSITDPRGNTTQFEYDARGYLHFVRDPNNNETEYNYDAWGRLLNMTDADGVIVSYQHDKMNRIISFTSGSGKTTIYNYDDNGNLKEAIDPTLLATKKVYSYYAENDLMEKIEVINTSTTASHLVVKNTYDTIGRLTGITNGMNKTWTTTFDPLTGVVKETRTPTDKLTTFDVYDGNGRLKQQKDRTGRIIGINYDADGRMINQNITKPGNQAGEQYTYGYKLNNLLDYARSSTKAQVSFNYTNRGQVSSYTYEPGKTIYYTYDPAGNLKTIIYPGSKTVTYNYNNRNLLETVVDWLGRTTTYTYSNAGRLRRITYPGNSAYIEYIYDPYGRLQAVNNRRGADNSIIAGFVADSFDALDRPLQITKTGGLEPAAIPFDSGWIETDDDNQTFKTGTTTIYGRNNLGERTTRAKSGVTTTYTWDSEDKPGVLRAVSGGTIDLQFGYDALGNRISAARSGTVTKYIIDPSGSMANVIAETNSAGAITAYYIHGIGLIARIDALTNEARYYHYDRTGNTVALTDSSGAVTDQYAYDLDPFAFNVTKSESTSNPFTFVGQFGVMDEGDNLFFMRARYYDAAEGKFLNEDPIGFEGGDLNLYAYVGGDPVSWMDPTGLSGETLKMPSQPNASQRIKELEYWLFYERSKKDPVLLNAGIIGPDRLEPGAGAAVGALNALALFEQQVLLVPYHHLVLDEIEVKAKGIWEKAGEKGTSTEIHRIRMKYDDKYRREHGDLRWDERASLKVWNWAKSGVRKITSLLKKK